MKVYHGTDIESAEKIIEDGIDLMIGDQNVDNGPGFYTTPNINFAMRRAEQKVDFNFSSCGREEQFPVVIEIDIDETAFERLRVMRFVEDSLAWKRFIVYNRLGLDYLMCHRFMFPRYKNLYHNLRQSYDIVIDEAAGSGVTDAVTELKFKNNASLHDLNAVICSVNKSDLGQQISFHTESALKVIRSMEICDYSLPID